jgi:hypothetical protein
LLYIQWDLAGREFKRLWTLCEPWNCSWCIFPVAVCFLEAVIVWLCEFHPVHIQIAVNPKPREAPHANSFHVAHSSKIPHNFSCLALLDFWLLNLAKWGSPSWLSSRNYLQPESLRNSVLFSSSHLSPCL